MVYVQILNAIDYLMKAFMWKFRNILELSTSAIHFLKMNVFGCKSICIASYIQYIELKLWTNNVNKKSAVSNL